MGKKRSYPDYMTRTICIKRPRSYDTSIDDEADKPHRHNIPAQGEDVYSPNVDISEFSDFTEDEEEDEHENVRYPVLNKVQDDDSGSDDFDYEVRDDVHGLLAPAEEVKTPRQLRAERRAAEDKDDGVEYTDDEEGEEYTDDEQGEELSGGSSSKEEEEFTDDEARQQVRSNRFYSRAQDHDAPLPEHVPRSRDLSVVPEELTDDEGSLATSCTSLLSLSSSLISPSSSLSSSSSSSLSLSSYGSASSSILCGEPGSDIVEIIRYIARMLNFMSRAKAHGIDVGSAESLARVSPETWRQIHVPRLSADKKVRAAQTTYAQAMLETILRLEVWELCLLIEQAEALELELGRLGVVV